MILILSMPYPSLADKEHGCFYSPPYVDDYGETDEGLRRGNPLFFCQVGPQMYLFMAELGRLLGFDLI